MIFCIGKINIQISNANTIYFFDVTKYFIISILQ